MIIEPAIDLKDGKVVRLRRGDFGTVHRVAEDAVATAEVFVAAGARYVHMVDLDGARSGERRNADVVRRVAERTGLRIELGGGIRTMTDLDAVLSAGVYRAVIGSAAVESPEFVARAAEKYGDRIAVGVDARNGRVKTEGWMHDSGLDYIGFARSMEDLGVRTLIFTDIDTDGVLSGPSWDRLAALQDAVSCRIIASGGVSCNGDIERLAAMGLYGAIIGKAYYSGAVDLKAAVQAGGVQ